MPVTRTTAITIRPIYPRYQKFICRAKGEGRTANARIIVGVIAREGNYCTTCLAVSIERTDNVDRVNDISFHRAIHGEIHRWNFIDAFVFERCFLIIYMRLKKEYICIKERREKMYEREKSTQVATHTAGVYIFFEFFRQRKCCQSWNAFEKRYRHFALPHLDKYAPLAF